MRVLFIFIDGLGIGKYDPTSNPCTDHRLKIFNNFMDKPRDEDLPYGGKMKPIDATLGLSGLPQSATGQAALLTGVNAAQLLGKHLSGFPNQRLRELLAKESIMTNLKLKGLKPAFINAYRPIFFLFGPEKLLRFLSVTSVANWKAGLKFFNFDDLRAEKSIYHDFSNASLIARGFNVPRFTPQHAGSILARVSQSYDFCLYEYFKTDKAGHAQSLVKAADLLYQLEQFVLTTIVHTDLRRCLIIITSDHGNIEDLTIHTHTRNPVPLFVWGKDGKALIDKISAINELAHILQRFIS